MMAGIATTMVAMRATHISVPRPMLMPAMSAAMLLARPFIMVSSVLMASISAQISIRKCIHNGNTSEASAKRATATSG